MIEPPPQISADAAADLVRLKPALCIGPGATAYRGVMTDIRRAVVARLSVLALPSHGSSYLDLGDVVSTNHPKSVEQFRAAVKDELQRVVPSPDLSSLVNVNWAACVSLTPDTLFEQQLQERFDRQASSRTVTIVTAPRITIPPRTVPIYRLLGIAHESSEDSRLAYSESDVLFRHAQWPGLLATFSDFLRDSPLFFVGTEDVASLTAQFLSVLYAGPRPHPEHLIFLRHDPTPNLPVLAGVLRRSGARVSIVDSDIRTLANALEASRAAASPAIAESSADVDGQGPHLRDLVSLKYVAEVVPSRKSVLDVESVVTHEIIDGLFRPTSNDWRPYAHELDLERGLLKRLLESTRSGEEASTGIRAVVVHGAAGTGKTTLLRRFAIEMASVNHLVLWCNRATAESTRQLFRKLARSARDVLVADKSLQRRLYVVVDDPWSLRVTASDVLAELESAQFPVTLVVGMRTSDYLSIGQSSGPLPAVPDVEVELPHELDSVEIERLPKMLVGIKACKDEDAARELISDNPFGRADDFLCSLWYLVPDTRSQIQASLEDEYRRLGDLRAVIEGAAASALHDGEVARNAYEAVTVCSSLNIALPVEVLVRALNVDYGEWMALARPGKPLWGLLYDEFDSTSESVVYRTRNKVVTDVLLRLVNGALGGHSGQYRLLKQLLAACTVASPPYRTFIHDVLVRSRSTLEDLLSYEQGLDLYSTAAASSPYPTRAVEHHRGIWIKNVGKDFAAADSQLRKALEVPDAPGSNREEPQAYIHTSLAATVLAQVRAGQVERDVGFERVIEHLNRSRVSGFFNANQSHVMASTLFEMAQIGGSMPDALRLGCLSASMAEIERSLQVIGAPGRTAMRHQKALALFEDLQRRIIEDIGEIDDIEEAARRIFSETKSQIGLEAWARAALVHAIRRDSGTDYNIASKVLQTIFSLVNSADQVPSDELRAIRVDLIVRWRLQKARGEVNWGMFLEDLEFLVRSPRFREDSLKKFYYAVALYQQGRITEAHAMFAALRRDPTIGSQNAHRCYFVGPAGFAKRFQGTTHSSHGRRYVSISELNDDVLAHGSVDSGSGATEHVYIAFSMNGPVAVRRSPGPNELLLP